MRQSLFTYSDEKPVLLQACSTQYVLSKRFAESKCSNDALAAAIAKRVDDRRDAAVSVMTKTISEDEQAVLDRLSADFDVTEQEEITANDQEV